MKDCINAEVEKLEDRLWSIAERKGIKRTHEAVDRFQLLVAGIINLEVASTIEVIEKFPGYDFSRGINEIKSADSDEIGLAAAFMAKSQIIKIAEGEEGFEGALRLLCEVYHASGMIEISVASGTQTVDLSKMFSRLGSLGGFARSKSTVELMKWAVDKYHARKWKSANEAAHTLQAEVLAHGRTIGAALKPSNAQRTIAEWFRKADKSV